MARLQWKELVPIRSQTSGFPFTIDDVAALLRLNIRRRSPDYLYADCPICGDRRGKLCINLRKNVWYSNCCGDSGGMLALYARVYGIGSSDAYREICEALMTGDFAPEYEIRGSEKAQVQEQIQVERASAQEIHQTYSMLLSMLSLTQAHQKHLQEVRGLSAEQIRAFGFKSTPSPYLCRSLTEQLIKHGCTVQGVPGFYVNDNGKWTVKFFQRTSGILIPFRRIDGLICGLQIRLDRPIKNEDDPPDKSGAKYLSLASTGKTMGVSSGNMLHFIGDPCARVVYVTEGALKASICHVLTGRTFAATVGANNVALLDELFALLSKNGTEEIIEAEDMDKYRNVAVNKGASKVYLMAKKYGMNCRRLTWNPNYKGLDDWLLALRRKENQEKEGRRMNFKQRYLFGLSDIGEILGFVDAWHSEPENGITLRDYLGLTEQEYTVFMKENLSGNLKQFLDAQRRQQHFRIYQLDLENGRTKPFAFAGMDKLREAGYEQPPAAEYLRVCDSSVLCPMEATDDTVLEHIFDRHNGDLPKDYHGRSVAPSDVIELYDTESRRYFYRDTAAFVPVKFSPMLSKPARE